MKGEVMSKGWIEWNGEGEVPVGYVDVMFRGGDTVEGYESDYWCWGWVTGDSRSEIVAYRKHRFKKPENNHKRPEFTFKELCFMLDMSPTQAGVMFACMLHNIHHYTQYVACKTILSKWKTNDYADKHLRKKLKLYVKWLQREMSKRD